MMYSTWYDRVDELEGFLRELNASIPVVHVEKGVGERISRNEPGDTEEAVHLFEINCALAQKLGAKTLVLHLWNGVHSDGNIAHNIAAYAPLNAIAQEHGILLTVENVVCSHGDPLSHMKELARVYPGIRFTFDTKMAQFHAQTDKMTAPENAWLWEHIAHMHVNDYKGGYMDWKSLRTLHIGEGDVDFESLFAFVRRVYKGDFTIEGTSFDQTGAIDFEKLNRTVRLLRALTEK